MKKPAKFNTYLDAMNKEACRWSFYEVMEEWGINEQELNECEEFESCIRRLDEIPEQKTCHFIPEVMWSYEDEDGNEIDSELMSPFDDCGAADCSACGGAMITGDCGWFDEEEQLNGGIKLIPKFKYCPYCGAKVVQK